MNSSSHWPLIMAFIRLPLALGGYALAVYFFRPAGVPVGAVAGMIWATVTISVVNLISWGLLRWRFRVEQLSFKAAIGLRKGRVWADVGWGLLWSFLLFGLLSAGFALTMLAVGGVDSFINPEAFFWGGRPNFSFPVPFLVTLVSALVFPLLNPPIEELHYRGYVQARLIAQSGRVYYGIVIAALGFGLQHMAFAMTLPAALAFAGGFWAWGLGAGVIAHKQQRLFPLIVAHFISNLSFGVMPLVFSLAR